MSFNNKEYSSHFTFGKDITEEEAKRLATADRRLMEIWRYFEVEGELEDGLEKEEKDEE